jgi:hypothetical protein
MSIKKSLTKAHPHGMKKNVKASTTPRKNSLLPKARAGSLVLEGKSIREILECERQEKIQKAMEALKKFNRPILSAEEIKNAVNFGRKY